MLAEKASEFNTPLYMYPWFVDLRKAYGSMSRGTPLSVLKRRYHIPDKLLRILQVLCSSTKWVVCTSSKVSSECPSTNDVRQGNVQY